MKKSNKKRITYAQFCKMQDNRAEMFDRMRASHAKYLKESTCIGFTQSFTESPDPNDLIDEITVKLKCRTHFDVIFKVRYTKLLFGEKKEYKVDGIITDRVDIAQYLPLNGHGSYCCYDEADTMEQAVVIMCQKHDLEISRKECSWPWASATVQGIEQLVTMLNKRVTEPDLFVRKYDEYAMCAMNGELFDERKPARKKRPTKQD